MILAVLILAALVRFWGYDHRFLLGSDSARDALVAREMLSQHKLPLIGSFSSAGPFTFGPWWYWFVAAGTALWPKAVITPWIATTMATVVAVYFLFLAGKLLGGFKTGIFAAILGALSPASLAFAANLTQHTMAGVFSAIAIWAYLQTLVKGDRTSFFILGSAVGMAINMHYQALGLLPLLTVVLWVRPFSLKKIVFLLLGFVLTFIPLLAFDIQNNWLNLRGLSNFYTTRQYAFAASGRWITYLVQFWPTFWAKVIGGGQTSGLVLIGASTFMLAWALVKKQLSRSAIAFLTTFALSAIMLRYFRGDRLDSYLLFLHPFVILTSALALGVAAKINRWIAIVGLIIVIWAGWPQVRQQINVQSRAAVVKQMTEAVNKKFPSRKITLYDGYLDGLDYSLPLALFLSVEGKISDSGTPVGLCKIRCAYSGPTFATFSYEKEAPRLDDLSGRPDITPHLDQSQEDKTWFLITPGSTYHSSIEWWKPYATSR